MQHTSNQQVHCQYKVKHFALTASEQANVGSFLALCLEPQFLWRLCRMPVYELKKQEV